MFSIERDVYFWVMDQYEDFLKEAKVKGLDVNSDWEIVLNRKKAELLAIEAKIFKAVFSGQAAIFAEITVSEEEIASFEETAKNSSYFQEDSDLYKVYRYHLEAKRSRPRPAVLN